MKKIMILGASILQLPAIKKAKEMGLYVISVDMDENAIGFKEADEYYVISTINEKKVLELAEKIKPDGIITVASDKPMKTVAMVGEKLGLSTISLQTAIRATNKIEMRKCLKNNKVPIPKFYIASSFEEYMQCIKNFDDKFIVKPADNSGSRGIVLVEDLYLAENAYYYSSKNSTNGEILVEEFMEGKEVSVESITVNGVTSVIAITDKKTTGAPHFVELEHTIPSRLDYELQEKIKKVTCQAINAIGIINGASHTEIKITKDGPKIVEIGARLGGDNITSDLVPLSTGVNMIENVIKIALNESIEISTKLNKVATIKYISSNMGILNSISGIENARKVDGVNKVNIYKSIGDKICKIQSSNDRFGAVILVSDSYEENMKNYEEAVKNINIEIR